MEKCAPHPLRSGHGSERSLDPSPFPQLQPKLPRTEQAVLLTAELLGACKADTHRDDMAQQLGASKPGSAGLRRKHCGTDEQGVHVCRVVGKASGKSRVRMYAFGFRSETGANWEGAVVTEVQLWPWEQVCLWLWPNQRESGPWGPVVDWSERQLGHKAVWEQFRLCRKFSGSRLWD